MITVIYLLVFSISLVQFVGKIGFLEVKEIENERLN
jgi:hypothetical protein